MTTRASMKMRRRSNIVARTHVPLLVLLAILVSPLPTAVAFSGHHAVVPSLIGPSKMFKLASQRHTYSKVPKETLGHTTSSQLLSTPQEVDPAASSPPLLEGPFVGIRRDLSSRLPYYLPSDITDGWNVQCVAATMFLFFACLAPAIAFGGLFETATAGAIGTVEMVTSTAVCGAIYALLSAQPLTIIGSTGPVLAFIVCLAQFARQFSLPFLPLYAWTGLWTAGILGIASLTSASNLVRYLTRFTDEIFATLISCIFIVEALSDVKGQFVGRTAQTIGPALLTALTAGSTFLVANTLKGVRNSVYFTKTVRNAIANFAPTIGVITGTVLATIAPISLPALSIPTSFGVTTSGRAWLVPLGALPVWARWASFLPACMATVLLFLDQNITVRLVNNPRFKLKKGRTSVLDGMHWDMAVIAILTAFQSLLGLPWLVAATVRSVSHSNALALYGDSKTGEQKRTGTLEQRVTGFSIHALMGLAIGLSKPRRLLSKVPLSVLMGLFLYLGVSSLPGNELWERVQGIFQDKSVAPQAKWSNTPRNVVNIFTAIQMACLGGMFWVKESRIGVLFPVIIALLAPLRYGLERWKIIPTKYMNVLDTE